MVCRSLICSVHSSLFYPDVINVSGHRLSTAEIESALIMHSGVAETAGQFCFYSILDVKLMQALDGI